METGGRAGAAHFEEVRGFDAVACQFGAMFFPDKVQGYKERTRVLKSGGHFFFNVWDAIDLPDVITQELAAVFPNDPPRPHTARLSRREAIRAELKAAGFTNSSMMR